MSKFSLCSRESWCKQQPCSKPQLCHSSPENHLWKSSSSKPLFYMLSLTTLSLYSLNISYIALSKYSLKSTTIANKTMITWGGMSWSLIWSIARKELPPLPSLPTIWCCLKVFLHIQLIIIIYGCQFLLWRSTHKEEKAIFTWTKCQWLAPPMWMLPSSPSPSSPQFW